MARASRKSERVFATRLDEVDERGVHEFAEKRGLTLAQALRQLISTALDLERNRVEPSITWMPVAGSGTTTWLSTTTNSSSYVDISLESTSTT